MRDGSQSYALAFGESHCGSEQVHAQLQASLSKLRDEFQSQLATMECKFTSQTSEMKDSCTTLIAKVERRLELLEEELSVVSLLK